MNATHTCNLVTVLPVQRPLWVRAWSCMQAVAAAWRAAAHQRQSLRALQGLSDETLRDIGMAERLPSRSQTLGLLDYERGRWS